MHGGAAKGLQVQLVTGNKAEYTLRPQGTFTGRREYQLVHHGQVIGQVSYAIYVCNAELHE